MAGSDALLHCEKIKHDICDVEGTVVHVAIDGIYAGYIVIADELKEDALEAVQSLRSLGVRKIIMLTGDNRKAAESVAKKLGLDAYLAELLPEDKVSAVEKLIKEAKKGKKVSFVGDGINDAPVIARADVGIAMGAGQCFTLIVGIVKYKNMKMLIQREEVEVLLCKRKE